MKLRIGPELRRQLAIVKLHGFSAADAVNCAARRWERYGKPDLSEAEAGTTYGGTVVTVEPPAGMDADAGLVFQELAGPAAPVSVRSRQADRGQGLHDCERGVKLRKLIYAKSYDSGIC